jgi:glutamine synthetase
MCCSNCTSSRCLGWSDLHGALRGKTLMPDAVPAALAEGVSMVSTVMLKDTSDRTAYKVFEPGALAGLSGFGFANNLLLLPDPASLRLLPWAPGTAWMRAMPWFGDATPVPIDPRRALDRALAELAARGFALRCGLEVEFHIYRITDPGLDPAHAAWPGRGPEVQMLHPGYNLLAEGWADMADEAMTIVRRTAQGLALPLRSLEVELGPSQFEAVFEATDAMTAADQMVLFRNGVKQALARSGYHATFMCRPPFPEVMASGWHLHHSLVDAVGGANLMRRDSAAAGTSAADPQHLLSARGEHWLGGLLAHARAMAIFCTPTANGFGRFRPNALAPMSVLWGCDNRGASFRVLGGPGDKATRIENRIGEPLANPYFYVAAQVHAGLDGLTRELSAGPATDMPYAAGAVALPTSIGEALDALAADEVMTAGFGAELSGCIARIKRAEQARFEAAEDRDEWQRREYFSRY